MKMVLKQYSYQTFLIVDNVSLSDKIVNNV